MLFTVKTRIVETFALRQDVLRHRLFTLRDASSSLRSRDTIPGKLLVGRLRGILPRGTLRRAPAYAVRITAVYRWNQTAAHFTQWHGAHI
jgi:hypothetical protein